MRSLTSISIGIIAGAVTSAARPDAKAFANKEARSQDELLPTPTVALKQRNVPAAATTIVEPPPFTVTLCPQPTGIYGAVDLESDLIYGCQAGYVCNPKKPAGCNFWPGLPDASFRCHPEDCMVAPPPLLANWPEGKTGYIPHQDGYFYLDPHIFGLTYDIFEYNVVKKIQSGSTSTYTTGNWGSQAQAYGSVPTNPPSYGKRASSPFQQQARRKANYGAKRAAQDLPQDCMGPCQDALTLITQFGKKPEFCEADSAFEKDFNGCVTCIAKDDNIDISDLTAIAAALGDPFVDTIFFCNTTGTTPPPTSSAPESQVTGSNTLGSTSQIPTSPTSLIDSTTSSSIQSTTSSTKQSTPPPTSSSSTTSTPPPPPTSSSTKPPPPPTSSSTPPPPPTSSSTKASPPPASSTSSSSQQASSAPPSSASTPPSSSAGSSGSSTTAGSPGSSSEIGTNSPTGTGSGAGSPPGSGSPTGTGSSTGTPAGTGAGSPTGSAAGTGTGSETGTGANTGTGAVTGAPTQTGTNRSTGVTPPSSDFSSPGQLERASTTNPGNSGNPGGGAEPTGTNSNGGSGRGSPGGVGPTGSPTVGGGSPGNGNPGNGGNPGGGGGASGTGTNPSSPTNSLPPPLSNDLSRPSENFGLLIVVLLGLLVF
ncbi:agglutinin-like protein ARB_02240 [Trichoderma asperellum]|uniref:Agglutinin-like protein ARB_02240 n=1 Tax=Trichoderma asperellum TaxID=101201 RepID=A0A6V8QMS7_TRIAP|nr:agglutinin-like protein ARB_02240 [Trichoderma asperellum]